MRHLWVIYVQYLCEILFALFMCSICPQYLPAIYMCNVFAQYFCAVSVRNIIRVFLPNSIFAQYLCALFAHSIIVYYFCASLLCNYQYKTKSIARLAGYKEILQKKQQFKNKKTTVRASYVHERLFILIFYGNFFIMKVSLL